MTAALTPALALDYLHALSADLRAAVVLDTRGNCLAGPPALGEAARAVLAGLAEATAPAPPHLEGTTDAGSVFIARDDHHAIVAVTGPHALPRLSRQDVLTALVALGAVNPVDGAPTRLSHAAVSALLEVADDGFRRPRAV